MNLPAYVKSIVAGIVAVVGVLTPLVADDVFSTEDAVQMALWVLSATGVYALPNKRTDIPNSPELVGNGEVLVKGQQL